jgi:hypothetical protein
LVQRFAPPLLLPFQSRSQFTGRVTHGYVDAFMLCII